MWAYILHDEVCIEQCPGRSSSLKESGPSAKALNKKPPRMEEHTAARISVEGLAVPSGIAQPELQLVDALIFG